MKTTCNTCEVQFNKKPSQVGKNNYCCHECYSKSKTHKIETVCFHCGNRVKLVKSQYIKSKKHFCNDKCFRKHKDKRVKISCAVCYKELFRSPSSVKEYNYCSKECSNHKENNPSWKGGVSSLNRLLRRTKEYKEWRLSVFKRDDFKCTYCLSKENIEAHHLSFFSDDINNRYNINNGVTLCRKCHKCLHF